MLKAANKTIASGFTATDAGIINCDDIYIIAKLWNIYSNGHFGLFTQAKIYQEVQEDYSNFSIRVGWKNENQWVAYNNLDWSLNAPRGHLPWIQGRVLYHSSHPDFNFNSFSLALGDIAFGLLEKWGSMNSPVIHNLVNKIRLCCKHLEIY